MPGQQLAPPYPPYPVPARPQRSGMAIVGFCLGLATVVIGIALTWVGTIMGIAGLIFSLVGLSETSYRSRIPGGPRTGRIFAIFGAVLSLVGITGSIALLIYVLMHLADFGITLPERTR